MAICATRRAPVLGEHRGELFQCFLWAESPTSAFENKNLLRPTAENSARPLPGGGLTRSGAGPIAKILRGMGVPCPFFASSALQVALPQLCPEWP